MHKHYPIRNLIAPLFLVILFFWLLESKSRLLLKPELFWLTSYDTFLQKFLGIGFCLSVASLINNLLKSFLWYLLLECYLKIIIPQLIKDFISILIYFIAILVIISQVFGESITALLAASGLMGLVIGMAVQNIISDLFSGITLNFDPNFRLGDAVNLHDISKKGNIKEITWRSTRLETEGTGVLIIPNSLISTMTITNTTQHRIDREELSIVLNGSLSSEHIIPILINALKTTEGIIQKPVPFAQLSRFDNQGVIYKLYYWHDNTKISNPEIRHALLQRIISDFANANISLSRNKSAEEEITFFANLENRP